MRPNNSLRCGVSAPALGTIVFSRVDRSCGEDIRSRYGRSTMNSRHRSPLLAAAYVACAATIAHAQADFPARPVRMVNPYTPGGSVDLVGRALAAGLAEAWGQQVIVDNRPGAGT